MEINGIDLINRQKQIKELGLTPISTHLNIEILQKNLQIDLLKIQIQQLLKERQQFIQKLQIKDVLIEYLQGQQLNYNNNNNNNGHKRQRLNNNSENHDKIVSIGHKRPRFNN